MLLLSKLDAAGVTMVAADAWLRLYGTVRKLFSGYKRLPSSGSCSTMMFSECGSNFNELDWIYCPVSLKALHSHPENSMAGHWRNNQYDFGIATRTIQLFFFLNRDVC